MKGLKYISILFSIYSGCNTEQFKHMMPAILVLAAHALSLLQQSKIKAGCRLFTPKLCLSCKKPVVVFATEDSTTCSTAADLHEDVTEGSDGTLPSP